jgi:outer membrane protein
MSFLKKTALSLATATVLTSATAMAHEAGDFIVRVGGAYVVANDSADCFDGPTAAALATDCLEPGVQNDIKMGLTLGYMFTDNIGVQLLGSAPFNHRITADLDGTGLGVVGRAKQLPPTLTLNWYFNQSGSFNPFVGAGVNYTHFFNENTTGALDALGVKKINLSDSWGAAGTAGFDWNFGDDFMLGVQMYYIKLSTEAHIGSGVGNSDVDVDPWVFFAGIGKKF